MSGHVILHSEHELLGAVFEADPQTGCLIPVSYASNSAVPGEKNIEAEARCYLSDLSGHTYQLISGLSASAFVNDAFAGPSLEVGDLSFQPAFTGDGNVVSIALVARTGDNECFYLDVSSRGAMLSAWLADLSTEKEQDRALHYDVHLENADLLLVPLLLIGPDAKNVLSDYLKDTTQALPMPGKLSFCLLDTKIAALIGHMVLGGLDAFVVLIRPQQVRTIWRSFLSFTIVTPLGGRGLALLLSHELPWFRLLNDPNEVTVPQDLLELDVHGFVRKSRNFIGGQALQ